LSEWQGPILWVLATPIGNLSDVSERAVRVLKDCHLIAAEDTRVARKLLHALGIEKKEVISYYDQIEEKRAGQIIARMEREALGVVLLSDAGTPCISDPGFRLVAAAHEAGIKVSPIPGASALTALVSASGLSAQRLLFVGFLPTKTGARQKEIGSWKMSGAGIVFFESMRRLSKTFEEILEVYPAARVAIGRELTKVFEEVVLLPIQEALAWSQQPNSQRGEGVIMLDLSDCHDGLATDKASLDRQIFADATQAFLEGASLRDLLREYRDCGLSRAELYAVLLRAKDRE